MQTWPRLLEVFGRKKSSIESTDFILFNHVAFVQTRLLTLREPRFMTLCVPHRHQWTMSNNALPRPFRSKKTAKAGESHRCQAYQSPCRNCKQRAQRKHSFDRTLGGWVENRNRILCGGRSATRDRSLTGHTSPPDDIVGNHIIFAARMLQDG